MKTLYLIVGIIIGLFLCRFLRTCEGNVTSGGEVIKRDTVVVFLPAERDSTIKPQPVKIVKGETIYKVVNTPYPVPFETKIIDTVYIVNDFPNERTYKERFKFENGVVTVDSKVSQNQLTFQKATLDSVKQLTVTNTVREPKKVRGYLVGTVAMSAVNAVSFGGGFMMQFKNNNALEAQVLYSPKQFNQQFQLSYKHKISFGRK